MEKLRAFILIGITLIACGAVSVFIMIGVYLGDRRPSKGTAECTAAQEAIFKNPPYYMDMAAGQIVRRVNDACK